MSVEAVIFDISGTVLEDWRRPQPGIVEAIEGLRNLGIVTLAAANESREFTLSRLDAVGLLNLFDHIVTRSDVGIPKGSPRWVDEFLLRTHLQPNQFLYVGDSELDMVTATRGPMLYAHAGWSGEPSHYGLVAASPAWVMSVVEHIFRKPDPWFWSLETTDQLNRPVHVHTVLDGNGAGSQTVKDRLISLLKRDHDSDLGDMRLSQFVMLHLLASIYGTDLFGGVDFWTTYPGSAGTPNAVMGNFLDVAAKLSRNRYLEDLFFRHTPARRSNDAWREGGAVESLRNQLTSLRLNEKYRELIPGSRVLVLDNFVTWGPSMETARNLLLAANAAEVVVGGIGKYGSSFYVATPPDEVWDPFHGDAPDASRFRLVRHNGHREPAVLEEYLASYIAIRDARL
jgi:hypothetical protein